MPPLKVQEQPEFGGVDSRSNPMAMPQNRLLDCVNWVPKPDGHLELRYGYTYANNQPLGAGGPIHSIFPFLRLTDGKNCILFWVGTTPYVWEFGSPIFTPPIRGAAIKSANPWQYALGQRGFIYMHNGTDYKFFDGATFRDIGLPTITAAQAAAVSVTQALSGVTQAQASATTMSLVTSGGSWIGYVTNYVYMSFFDLATNILMNSTYPLSSDGGTTFTTPDSKTFTTCVVNISGLPVVATNPSTTVGLLAIADTGTGGAEFCVQTVLTQNATVSNPSGNIVRLTYLPSGHGLTVGGTYVIVWPITSGMTQNPGPYAAQAIDINNLQFTPTEKATDFIPANPSNVITGVSVLLTVPNGTTTASIKSNLANSVVNNQGQVYDSQGALALDFANSVSSVGLPASTVGGAQPGYQFYVSIYNPVGGQHVGNRVAIGQRLDNTSQCIVNITGLPNLAAEGPYRLGFPKTGAGKHWGNGPKIRSGPPVEGGPIRDPITGDSEWVLLIGRTGDGGEVPYAIMDSGGNWVTVPSGQTSISIDESQIDGNSELPTANYIPPAFACFWREGDRQCGSVVGQPWVYRSASEADDTSGIFVGDPAQAWDPSKVETFPTAEAIIGGFGYMQESWVFTQNDMGQLSELSGEVAWNGPYNVGIAGPRAFDSGWNGLPFWVSHDKQLFTMLPNGNGPEPISEEYEAALLSGIGDNNISGTAVNYYREAGKQIEVLRIKCLDKNGVVYNIIHDFKLREPPNSAVGQGYQDDFNGALASDYYPEVVRDGNGHLRFWCGAADGNIYQLYTGGDDNGTPFVADAIGLWYLGAYNTELRTVEWYGDALVQWFITPNLDATFQGTVPPNPPWVNLAYMSRPVPGEEHNSHYMMDVVNPEQTHSLLWAHLDSHPADAPNPVDPMTLSAIPHVPLETYGRVWMVNPVIADSRGR